MAITATEVLNYINDHSLQCHKTGFTSVLEMLHSVYVESNPIDTEQIQDGFSRLRHILDKLSPEDAESLFYLVCDLCLEYEQSAFAHGILAGLYLYAELTSLS